MTLSPRVLSLLTVVLIAACGSPLAPDAAIEELLGVRVRPTVESYAPGQPVTLEFVNRGERDLNFNPCFRTLERRTAGTEWRPVDEGERICPAYAIIWDRGSSISATTDLPERLSSGEYRFVFSVSTLTGDRYLSLRQASESFTVTP